MEGIVYLIQPVELVGTDRYKLGCSCKSSTQRLVAYKKNSRVLCVNLVKNPLFVEKKLKESFLQEFDIVGGNEYFVCNDETKMYLLFHGIVGKFFNAEEEIPETFTNSQESTTNARNDEESSVDSVKNPRKNVVVSDDSSDDFCALSDSSSSDSDSSSYYYRSSSRITYCKVTYSCEKNPEESVLVKTMFEDILQSIASKYVVVEYKNTIGVIAGSKDCDFEKLRNTFQSKITAYKRKNNVELRSRFSYDEIEDNIKKVLKNLKGTVVQRKKLM
jgi:hypothetical protein